MRLDSFLVLFENTRVNKFVFLRRFELHAVLVEECLLHCRKVFVHEHLLKRAHDLVELDVLSSAVALVNNLEFALVPHSFNLKFLAYIQLQT